MLFFLQIHQCILSSFSPQSVSSLFALLKRTGICLSSNIYSAVVTSLEILIQFFFMIMEGVPALWARLIPIGPGEPGKTSLAQCGSSVLNSQPPRTNCSPRLTELPLGVRNPYPIRKNIKHIVKIYMY